MSDQDQPPVVTNPDQLMPQSSGVSPDQLSIPDVLPPEFLATNLPPQKVAPVVSRGVKLKYKTVAELQAMVDRYFEIETIYTISGLAVALGTNRVTLLDYKSRSGYGKVINEAKAKVEAFVEKRLLDKGYNAAGAIFNLCNNYGRWHQKQEQDLNIGGQANNPIRINVNFTNAIASASVNRPSLIDQCNNDASVNQDGTQD